jgi:hypothetical protein
MSRNRCIVVAILGLSLAVVCGCLGAIVLLRFTGTFPVQPASPAEPAHTPTARPTSTPTTPHVSALCQAGTQDYLSKIQPLVEEWDDAVEVANSTARIALSPMVREMQGIKRDVEDVPVPDCARHGSALLTEGMKTIIDAFIAFMGDESDSAVSGYFYAGYQLMSEGLDELAGLAQGRLPATNTPVPTRVPPSATSTRAASAAVPTNTRVIRTPTPASGPPTPTYPPTATSPPPPTPTPTLPPLGTRANPVPREQTHLAPNGWEIVVLDFNPDAWPLVQAENQFNDPPRPGNRMVIVRLGMGNVSVDPQFYMAADTYFSLVGSRNVEYTTFGAASRCGVIPDQLLDKVFTGEYAEGNACFQIPTDETGLVLIYDPIMYPVVYFAVH